MTTTNFISGTVIDAAWLNDVDEAVYNGLPATQSFYTPAGAGAVATTVQAKLRESVSVLDFGAVGDGVTDDTAAFNAAWAASDPKAVLVLAGTYEITGAVIGKFYSFGVVTINTGTVTSIANLVP